MYLKEPRYLERDNVKVIPIVIEGLVKVFASFGERELLLYYMNSYLCRPTFVL